MCFVRTHDAKSISFSSLTKCQNFRQGRTIDVIYLCLRKTFHCTAQQNLSQGDRRLYLVGGRAVMRKVRRHHSPGKSWAHLGFSECHHSPARNTALNIPKQPGDSLKWVVTDLNLRYKKSSQIGEKRILGLQQCNSSLKSSSWGGGGGGGEACIWSD